jgi:hypothetical protein
MEAIRRKGMRITLAAAAALLLVSAAGCGSDDEEKSGSEAPKPTSMAVELSGSGKSLAFTAPQSVKGGLVELRFTNSTKKGASAQLVGADAGHTAEEALEAAQAWGEKGEPLPEWVSFPGGTGEVKPGTSTSVTQELPAGNYVVADIESNTNMAFKVTGKGASGSPSAPGRIAASEYKFTATGLKAGKQKIVFDNTGAEPHFIAAAEMLPGKTIADVRKFIEEEKGEPPINEESGFSSAVLEGQTKQSLEVDLKSGKVALLCFVPDRKGGPPHVAKGMVSEATVE